MAGDEVFKVRITTEVDSSELDPGLARARANIDAFQRLMRRVSVGTAAGGVTSRVERQLAQQQRHVLTIQRMTSQVETARYRAMTGRVQLQSREVMLQRQQFALRQAEARSARAMQGSRARGGGGIGPFAAFGMATQGVRNVIDAGRAFGRAVAGPVMLAAGIGESVNRLGELLGSSSASVRAFAETSANSFGISRSAALETAGGFAALFRSARVSQPLAADMSVQMVKLASDMASFHNIDPSVALEKLKSGLVGETEPLRTVGVLLSENAVQQEAYRSKIARTGATLTEQQKVLARYRLILRQTATAQGDYARTANALPNATRRVQALWTNLAERAAAAALPAATTGMNFIARILGAAEQAGSWSALTRSFDIWWHGGGVVEVRRWAGVIGKALGGGLSGVISGALGLVGPSDGTVESVWVRAGRDAGRVFSEEFVKAFDAGALAQKAKDAWAHNALPPGMGGQASGTSAAVTIGGTALAAAALIDRVRRATLVRMTGQGLGALGRLIRPGAAAAASTAGGVTAAGGAAASGGGLALLLRGAARFAGPVGVALTVMEVVRFLGQHPQAVAQAAGMAIGGHGHDLCTCIRMAVAQLIPVLSPQGRFQARKPAPATTGAGQPILPAAHDESAHGTPTANTAEAWLNAAREGLAKGLSGLVPGGNVITKHGQPIFSFPDKQGHRGIDIAAKAGSPIYSQVAGTVVDAAKYGLSAGYGRAVTLLDQAKNLHVFGHTSGGLLAPGTQVKPGDLLARVNATANKLPGEASLSDHLHYEIRRGGNFNDQIDPTSFYSGGGAGHGGAGAGVQVTLESGAVVLQLSLDHLDEAQAQRLADVLGGPIAERIVMEVGARLPNMPSGG